MPSVVEPPGSGEASQAAVTAVLRIGMAGCFIGHGAFGIITKAAWVPYFGVAGIGASWAWKLMPWIGTMDVAIGLLALVWPCRALLVWAVGWTVWTALLRPLSGEPFWEALERAGNYGVPLALLMLAGWHRPWLARLPLRAPAWSPAMRTRLGWILRLIAATLLAGHAGLGWFSHKAGLAHNYAALGAGDPAGLVPWVGAFEFMLAGLVLALPRPGLFVFLCVWKLATESLFLVAGAPGWEIIERFGSYTAPLALALLLWLSRPAVFSTASPAH